MKCTHILDDNADVLVFIISNVFKKPNVYRPVSQVILHGLSAHDCVFLPLSLFKAAHNSNVCILLMLSIVVAWRFPIHIYESFLPLYLHRRRFHIARRIFAESYLFV